MKQDDGFTRRGFMTTSVTVAAAMGLPRHVAGWDFQPSVCKLTPEQEIGPYYIADELVRADITEGRPGIPLELRIALQDSRTCKPLASAAVDVWHCDALGIYSGFSEQSRTAGEGGPGRGRGRGPGGPPQISRRSISTCDPANCGRTA